MRHASLDRLMIRLRSWWSWRSEMTRQLAAIDHNLQVLMHAETWRAQAAITHHRELLARVATLTSIGDGIMAILDPIRDVLVDLVREVGESNAKIDALAAQIGTSVDPAEVQALAQQIRDQVAALDAKNQDAVQPPLPPA